MRPASTVDVELQARPPANCLHHENLQAFVGSRFPVWVFDIEESRIRWANPLALDVWEASSLEELQARSFSGDMSTTVRTRLQQYQTGFAVGEFFDENWTIFPHGNPKTLACRFRGCMLAEGRLAMLCEAQELRIQDAELVKANQALLYTSVMVSTYSVTGRCTYANPSAHQSFANSEPNWQTRFRNDILQSLLCNSPQTASEGTYLSAVATRDGQRLHEVDLRLSYDPVDGQVSFLVTEVDVTERERVQQELAHLASTDPVTDLPNRTFLNRAAPALLRKAVAEGRTVGLFLFDLDRFKFVNDTLGHGAGDILLKEIGTNVRQSIPDSALFARLGGDEFCCLVAETRGEKALLQRGRDILEKIRRRVRVEGHSINSSGSIGLSIANDLSATTSDLLRMADLALFEAKQSGGNTLRVFRPEMAERSRRFVRIDKSLTEALAHKRFELHYQPRVCFHSGRIVAAEALIRLRSVSGELSDPDEFIPIAEATGRIAPIGRWVLREAFRHLVMLRENGHPIGISINVSPIQFSDPAFLALLRKLRPRLNDGSGDIELEITENILIKSDGKLLRILREIADMGYRFAIDDFGTAYSNLSSLTRYPISCIKIDRTLIAHTDFRLLVTGVMTIARSFGARIIAEGVEAEFQRQWLLENGCDEYQGFLFSRPVSLDQLILMLRSE
jgi:diguanylate cyclase (GGDEF)-like protein